MIDSSGDASTFERISHGYYKFPEAERKVADYVTGHPRDTQLMSISELGEACGVAEATVTRFCRRLGYKGYAAFKLAIANATAASGVSTEAYEIRQVTEEDDVSTAAQKLYAAECGALTHTLGLIRPEAFNAAADLLARSDKVLCMGQGGSMLLAMEAAHLFSTALPNYQAVTDSHLQTIAITHLTKRDTVLFFSYSGSTREVMELLPLARSRGAGVVLVTRFPKSPAAAYADVILQCGSNELPLQHGSMPALMGQLFVVDVLFSEVCRRKGEQSASGREQVAAALSGKHI